MAMKEMTKVNDAVVHVRFAGRSFDVSLRALDVSVGSHDGDVKEALARHLEVHPSRLRDYVVDRHGNGNLTVRPEAVFG
jgi:metallophosphoesterase superfamily enzyme